MRFLIIIQVQEDFSLEDAFARHRLLVHNDLYLSPDGDDVQIDATNI